MNWQGGVALNCVANGKIVPRGTGFRRIWVQPAAGDAGGALGAALAVWHTHLGHERPARGGQDSMAGALLGPRFDGAEIGRRPRGGRGHGGDPPGARELFDRVAVGSSQKAPVVGWFQGRDGVRPTRARRAAPSSATRGDRGDGSER